MSLKGGFGTLIKMKKPVIIVSFILFLIVSFLYVFAANNGFKACELETDKVCFDKELGQYQIEENANITIAVKSVEYGEAIKQLWSETHPDKASINYVLANETSNQDLIYGLANDMALIYDSLYPIDNNISNNRSDLSSELNVNDLRFIPLVGEGFAFITNKTELERLTGTWLDTNSNNIHDSFESFENIINAQAEWDTDYHKLVLSLSEPYTLYPYFTSNGWKLFEDYNSYYPGFEKENFLESLRFIEALSKINWNNSENNLAETYTWEYPSALFNDNFVFSQVSTWMYFEEMDIRHESEWLISSFPKAYESSETKLSPLLTAVYGYSINANTLYPSAAHELMRLVYSIEGLQVKINSDNEIILSNKEVLDQLVFNNEYLRQFSYAFIHSQSEPLIAVEDYPSNLAMRIYYEIDIEKTIQRLWNHEITVEEAQIDIALKSDDWIMHQSKLFEGKLNNE